MHVNKKIQTILIGFLCAFLLPSLAHAQFPIMFDSNYVSFYLSEANENTTTIHGPLRYQYYNYGSLQYHFVQHIKTIDTATELQFNKNLDQQVDKDYCYRLTKPTFAGSHVHLINDQGITVFNRNNEPVFFKLNALPDSSWLMYENRRQNTIVKAKIIAIKDSVIFDVVNEVRSIQIVFYDSLGKEKKQERFNRFVFLIGNKIGFLRLCYLGTFPSTCLNTGYDSCRIYRFAGYQNMEGTIKQGKTFFHLNELDDYEAGDEFHSISDLNSQYLSYTKSTINKCLQRLEVNDSLVFTFKERQHSLISDRNGPVPKLTDTVVEREHQVKRPISNAKPFNKRDYIKNQKDVYKYISQIGIDQYYWDESNTRYQLGDSCIRNGFSTDRDIFYRYRGIYGIEFNASSPSRSARIVYYKKGSKTWGIPLPQNIGVNEIAATRRVSAYPNPASKMAIIDITKAKQVRIVNSLGKWVNTTPTIDQSKVEINTETLTNGIYYVELITEKGTSRCTLVVEH
jgi:hypothetical protein